MIQRTFLLALSSLSVALAQYNETSGLNFEGTANLTTVRISDYLGNRTVAYHADSDGLAIVEGDIIYGTEAELLSRVIGGTPNVGPRSVHRRSHSVFSTGTPSPWPASTIRYRYLDDNARTKFSSSVNIAIQRWKLGHPCLNFVDIGSGTDQDAIVIQEQTNEPNVCRATVGYYGPTSSHIMKLWATCGPNEITHELGHNLGLHHEAKRHDREGYTHFNCKALKEFPTYSDPVACCGQGPLVNIGGTLVPDCCGYACAFTPYPLSKTLQNQGDCNKCGNKYDLQSIMHYRRSAFAAPGQETLTAGPTFNPSTPSPGDFCRIKELYPCVNTEPECPKFCSPFPGTNTCAQPSAQNCVGFGTSALYCACAPGFKATGYADNDAAHHWRVDLDGHQHRVWVAEGVKCETPCANPLTCAEVSLIQDKCWKP